MVFTLAVSWTQVALIDIYSIFYRVDNGAKTLEESLAMARQAVVGNTTDLVCILHSAKWFEFGPLSVMQTQVSALQAALDTGPP